MNHPLYAFFLINLYFLKIKFSFLFIVILDLSERVFVHLFDPVDNGWSEQQAFHTEEITSAQIVDAETDEDFPFGGPIVYISLTGGKGNPGVTVYEWDFENNEVKTPFFQEISY